MRKIAGGKLSQMKHFFSQNFLQKAKLHLFGGVGINNDYLLSQQPSINRIYYSVFFFCVSLIPLNVLVNYTTSTFPITMCIISISINTLLDIITVMRFVKFVNKSTLF